MGLVAYRVVQEALTNVVKHAGPCCARVRVSFEAHALDLHVTDTGTGPTSEHPQLTKPGHGLVGMRERVALYGGELRTGHRADGGYEVWARLPVVPTGPRQRTSCPDLPSRPGTEAPRPLLTAVAGLGVRERLAGGDGDRGPD